MFLVTCVAPTVLLMTLCCSMYCIALWEIHARSRRVLDLHQAADADVRLRKLERENSRSTRMMSVVMLSLVMTWIPYNIFSLLTTPEDIDSNILTMVTFRVITMLVFANSFNNAFIYAWASPHFRRAYAKLLRFR